MLKRLYSKLPKSRWKRVLAILAILVLTVVVGLASLALTIHLLFKIPRFTSFALRTFLQHQLKQPLDTPPHPHLSPEHEAQLTNHAATLTSAAQLFQSTNLWSVTLSFSSNQWTALTPKRIPPVPGFIQKDGSIILRNPEASRPGLLGVLGADLPWSSGNLTFGGVYWTNVAMRFKGNGTFVDASKSYKRPFKIDLNKDHPQRSLAGRSTLNFVNLISDRSYIHDALGYEFFREAGVPAPRTAFARVLLTIEGQFDNRLLGLYTLVENPDKAWATEMLGPNRVALFKPVTDELFKDLGTNWQAYEPIYSPKTKLQSSDQTRLIQFSRLVTSASDADFAAQLGSYVDLDAFARFLACQVLLSNYDSFLCNGQNYLMYLKPHTGQFGFIPWDLDHSWGEFPMVGTTESREQASIERPWVGQHRFLERCLKVPAFRETYRHQLDVLLTTQFTTNHLHPKIDALANTIRPFVKEEASTNRFRRFEDSVTSRYIPSPEKAGSPWDENRPAHQIKRFIEQRRASVRSQLDGKAPGVIPTRSQ